MRFFDPTDSVLISQRRLPHWSQVGSVVFITWRTADSIPKALTEEWRQNRFRWLVDHGIQTDQPDWYLELQKLPSAQIADFHQQFTTSWLNTLDSGHGACVLKETHVAKIIVDCLHRFDGIRYELLDYVIMPNHLHLLATFIDFDSMCHQCTLWKRFSARQINQAIGQTGRFWQRESFDHLVRHEAQYQHLKNYIRDNGIKAHLPKSDYTHWSKNSSK
jgi:putative transposase